MDLVIVDKYPTLINRSISSYIETDICYWFRKMDSQLVVYIIAE